MFAINLDIVFFCVESMNNSKPHSRYVRWILAMGVVLVGFAILSWIWNDQANFENQIANSQNKTNIEELLGNPDYSFPSKKQVVGKIEGGSYVFKPLPAKATAFNIRELPKVNGTACFYTDSWRGDSPIELGLSLGLGLVRH